jgi:hypothetical protein
MSSIPRAGQSRGTSAHPSRYVGSSFEAENWRLLVEAQLLSDDASGRSRRTLVPPRGYGQGEDRTGERE